MKKQATRGAVPVADYVSKLLDPVIERRAGMTMDLMASWAEIAGEQHAVHSRPEKLNWPRKADEDDPFEPATLVIACEGAHALFLQHECATLINNINSYFGFSAVARIKLVQKPITRSDSRNKRRKAVPAPDAKERLATMLAAVDDPKLREALEKMGRGVFTSGSED